MIFLIYARKKLEWPQCFYIVHYYPDHLFKIILTSETQLQILLQLFSVQWKNHRKNVKFSSPYQKTIFFDQNHTIKNSTHFSQKSYYSEVMTKN